MGLTKWQDQYSVGIDEVDNQHKILINCIASLEQAIEHDDEKQRWSAIHYAIVQLADYTRVHFSVEESLMQILNYPESDSHIAQHRMFVASLRDMERKSITQDVTEDDVVSFLRNWLLTHIANDDMKYAAYFATTRGVGGNRKGHD
jgi:hemerythrin